MANVTDKKDVKVFSNELKLVKVSYDITGGDSGVVGVMDMFEAKENMVIYGGWVQVDTLFASGGAATLEIGVKGGDTDAVLAATAVGSLTANATFKNDTASDALYLASGGILSAEVKVADMTAGKLTLALLVAKF